MDLVRWGLGFDCFSDCVFSYGGCYGYEDVGEMVNM